MTAGSPEFVTFVMATVAAYTAEAVENVIWIGSSLYAGGFLSNDGVYDNAGYQASIIGTAVVNEQAVTAAGFTAANVLGATGAFAEVYNNAVANAPGILNKTDITFYCSTAVAGKYMQALAASGNAQGVNLQATNQAFDTLQYLGIPLSVCPGMPDEALLLTHKENLVVGSNLNTDYTTAQYIDAWQFDGGDEVKIAMRFGLGCQVAMPSDVVFGAYAAILA
tara:strand:+ start:90 stop:755 length:666 start_codon:yes stop_codon:yes gene_type:complete